MAQYISVGKELKAEFEKEFGQLSARQLWLLVRLAKTARRSCRQNTAFNSFFGLIFGYAKFNQVTKTDNLGRTYQGLQIQVKDETIDDEGG